MSGPLHSPQRHAPETVAQAIELGDAGWAPTQIARILRGRGLSVSASSVRRWLDPERLEKDRRASRDRARRLREEARASAPDDPYKGLTGLSRKVAMLEDRLAALEAQTNGAVPHSPTLRR